MMFDGRSALPYGYRSDTGSYFRVGAFQKSSLRMCYTRKPRFSLGAFSYPADAGIRKSQKLKSIPESWIHTAGQLDDNPELPQMAEISCGPILGVRTETLNDVPPIIMLRNMAGMQLQERSSLPLGYSMGIACCNVNSRRIACLGYRVKLVSQMSIA